nr:thioesterase family protein [Rhodococcus kyotonensis]
MDSTATIPTYSQVTALAREFGPFVVPPEFEDENGHMNVRHYFDLAVEVVARVFDRIGIDDEYRASRGHGIFTAEHHLKYFAEVHAGETVSGYFTFVERSDKVFHAMAFLVDDDTKQLVYSLEVAAPHVDMTTRRVVPFADDLAATVDAEIASTAHRTFDLPVSGAIGVRRR